MASSVRIWQGQVKRLVFDNARVTMRNAPRYARVPALHLVAEAAVVEEAAGARVNPAALCVQMEAAVLQASQAAPLPLELHGAAPPSFPLRYPYLDESSASEAAMRWLGSPPCQQPEPAYGAAKFVSREDASPNSKNASGRAQI